MSESVSTLACFELLSESIEEVRSVLSTSLGQVRNDLMGTIISRMPASEIVIAHERSGLGSMQFKSSRRIHVREE